MQQSQPQIVFIQAPPDNIAQQISRKYAPFFGASTSRVLGVIVALLGVAAEIAASIEIAYFINQQYYEYYGTSPTYFAGFWCGAVVRINIYSLIFFIKF